MQLSTYQSTRIFLSVMVLLVVFGVALMSDIGWFWSFFAAHGVLHWFNIIANAIKIIMAENEIRA